MSRHIETLVNNKMAEIAAGTNVYEVGRVTAVKGYIVEAAGLSGIAYFERVRIGDHAEGYVTVVGRNSVKLSVVTREVNIKIGDPVVALGREFTARFSPSSVSHVIDIFGRDCIQDALFDDTMEIPVENPPIPIMERTAVNRPLKTGIVGIDLIYPIGKGQRQLIIGDKKTGKTQIALDTIANQKKEDVLCIYVAIGKTKKQVKELYQELLRNGAMDYTIILAAFYDDTTPVLYLTPYVATTIAEYYMHQGKDVLVVFDDLKCHASAHREISLLAGKVPGREAYPPDIFYIHSRLLERGCQHMCGGSITMLPIVETKGGDITSYISTNIISITDGQLVLSKKNFDKGYKPAINYGLSVSRLGGAVQEPDVRKMGASVRRELLSYLETREVYEMANMDEMSPEMRAKLYRGAKLLNGLGQYKFNPRDKKEFIPMFQEIMNQ